MFSQERLSKPATWFAPITIALLLAASPLAAAEDKARFGNMKDAMAALATHIGRTLKEKGLDRIAVKTFEGPSGTSASARIGQALSEQLKEQAGLDITTSGGSWSVAGDYFAKVNEVSGKLEVLIESQLKDQFGAAQAKLMTPIITEEQEMLILFGASADLPTQAAAATPPAAAAPPAAGAPPAAAQAAAPPAAAAPTDSAALDAARTQAVVNAIVNPQVAIAQGVVRAAADSPYGIEVLIGGKPVPARNEDGAAFVDIQKEQIYEIRLINDSDEDVGVTLTIDGVNTLEFSENPSYKALGKWVIGRRSTGRITGWHIVGNQSHAFQVLDFANSAAAKASSTRDIGTITAIFSAAFTGDPPPDEPARGKGGVATGFGPPVEQKLADVQRKFGVVRGSISVRYDKPQTELPPAELPPQPVVSR